MHALLRPAAGRPRAGVLEGLPDGLHQLRPRRGPAQDGGSARRQAARAGREARVPLRHRRQDAGRPELVLPAGGPAGGLQPAARPEAAHAAPPFELMAVRGRRHPGRPRRPRELPHAREPAMIPPPSTLFTTPPEWRWLIVAYFFLGGIAGGSYFIAVLIDLFGDPRDRPLARLGYLAAFPLVVVCGLLLILD